MKNNKILILTPYKIDNCIDHFKWGDLLGVGAWCNSESIHINIIENYLDNTDFDRDEFYNKIYESKKDIVSILSASLNTVHGVNYSRRYWDMILGPWLLRFVAMIYDKWMTVDLAFKTNSISGYVGIEDIDLTCDKFRNNKYFIKNTQDDLFNHMLYQDVLEFLGVACLTKLKIDVEKGGVGDKKQYPIKEMPHRLKYALIDFLVKIWGKEGRYYISNAYLDKCSMILLNLRFGLFSSCPSFDVIDMEGDEGNNLRGKLEKELLKVNKSDHFSAFLLNMVSKYIPCEYVEKYNDMQLLIKETNLPKRPKVIYTASLHLTSDVFNFWSAINVEHGARLVLGQHGGMYGYAKILPFEMHEFDICDRYVSWGWGKKTEKIIQVGMTVSKIRKPLFKYFSRKKNKSTLLIVGPKYPKYFLQGVSKDNTDLDWKNYFDRQIKLIRSLDRNKVDKIVFRSKSDWGSNVAHYKAFIQEVENVEFQDITDVKISTMVNKSKLVIVTYNATMLLQLLSSNIPMIAIWDKNNWSLRGEAEGLFYLLQSVGILHYDYKSASKTIDHIWSDVNRWWFGEDIQAVVNKFCSEFSGRTTCVQKSNIIKRAFLELNGNE